MSSRAADPGRVLRAARESGLVAAGEPLLVLVSGGGDSVCLLDVAVRLGARVSALHVDHGLRADSGEDAELCRSLCERLAVPLTVERVDLPAARGPGNLQAEARDARYALAERHAAGDYAAAHTASDQAETVLYRLAVSPGRRALLGMAARRGRLVRPLLAIAREDARAYCRARGLEWREDPTNSDLRFARARVRAQVLPALRELNPAAERNIAETAAQLRDEAEALDAALAGALAGTAPPPGPPAGGRTSGGQAPLRLQSLSGIPPALARLALRAAAGDAPISRRDAERILALPLEGTATVELPGGLRAVAEYGRLRFARGEEPGSPEPVGLPVPGSVEFGSWRVEAALGGSGDVLLAPSVVEAGLLVRPWRHGDRMRPVGLGGTKTLQDLFTDGKVPRAERGSVPVVEAGGRVAWVAGLALDERFRADPAAGGEAVALSARRGA
ncbi:MAG: tRNA(Ile)-lysidine synthase [Thermoleophilaceae bacterium]|nr:tRNA(Ile)-lysidine synthase [Thermoleophilaceae bacterium]